RDLAGFSRGEFGNNGAVTRDVDVKRDVGLAFHVDYLVAHFWLLPSLRSEVLAGSIEILDVSILNGWTNVCATPSQATIVADNDEGIAGKSDPGYIEIS